MLPVVVLERHLVEQVLVVPLLVPIVIVVGVVQPIVVVALEVQLLVAIEEPHVDLFQGHRGVDAFRRDAELGDQLVPFVAIVDLGPATAADHQIVQPMQIDLAAIDARHPIDRGSDNQRERRVRESLELRYTKEPGPQNTQMSIVYEPFVIMICAQVLVERLAIARILRDFGRCRYSCSSSSAATRFSCAAHRQRCWRRQRCCRGTQHQRCGNAATSGGVFVVVLMVVVVVLVMRLVHHHVGARRRDNTVPTLNGSAR